MERLIFCTIIFLLFIILDLMPIAKRKEHKVFWYYTILIALSYTVHVLFVLGIDVPSPAIPIADAIKALFNVRS